MLADIRFISHYIAYSNIASNCSIIREKGGIKWTYRA